VDVIDVPAYNIEKMNRQPIPSAVGDFYNNNNHRSQASAKQSKTSSLSREVVAAK